VTFAFTALAWIIFRSDSIKDAWKYISNIFSSSLFSTDIGKYQIGGKSKVLMTVILIIVFICVEWRGRKNQYALADLGIKRKWGRYLVYYLILVIILVLGEEGQQFIYFQF
jgi:hypothetical protein